MLRGMALTLIALAFYALAWLLQRSGRSRPWRGFSPAATNLS